MNKWIKVIVAIVAVAPTVAWADNGSLQDRFTRIQAEIEANCGECYGASKEKFVQAVQNLEQLIDAGFSEPAAQKLLAQSYETWAFVYEDSETTESRALLAKAQGIYRDLTKATPDDPTVWASYARSLEDHRQALEPLKRAESLSPGDPYIKFSLGMLYAHGFNDSKTGATYLEKAIELEDGAAKLTYLDQLANIYELSGDTARASATRTRKMQFEEVLEEKGRVKQPKK